MVKLNIKSILIFLGFMLAKSSMVTEKSIYIAIRSFLNYYAL